MLFSETFYITTPIYYVNDVPHIGHAYTSLACDVVARFMRLYGKRVMFLTGTDEHGQKVQKSAEKAGMTPQQFTDITSKYFVELSGYMNFSNDDFIRTTEERHKKVAQDFWTLLDQSGDIYIDKYSGWYSLRDEAYYSESELTDEGNAPTGAPVEWVEEPSYFFALSKYQDKLLEFYDQNPEFIKPLSRRNEVINFVKGGLRDLSISRTSFKWGVEVPSNRDHVMYVWLDALTNYISALGYGTINDEKYQKFWPANAHVVGKDILRFHAVYWPAFLMSAGIPLPKLVFAHGWWTNDGQKISKSIGNVIDPKKLVDEFGTDQVRYFLMREVIFGNDGNYSKDLLISRNNSELSNKIGNLVQRVCTFIYKNCERSVPIVSDNFIESMYQSHYFQEILDNVNIKKLTNMMENFDIHEYISQIVRISEKANLFVDQEAPWKLKNIDTNRMNEVLFQLLETIRYIGILLQPIIPDSANQLLDQIVIDSDERSMKHLSREFCIEVGKSLQEPKAIFPKL